MDPNVYSAITYEPSAFVLAMSVYSLRTCDFCLCLESILADIDLTISLAERGRRNVLDGRLLHCALHTIQATRDGGFSTRRFGGFRGSGYTRVVADLCLVAVDERTGR